MPRSWRRQVRAEWADDPRVYRYPSLRAGHLPGFRLGKTGCWYVLRCEFDRFLREGRWWLGERELAQRIEAAIAKGAEAAWRGAEVRFGPAQPEPAGYRVVREVRKGASR